MTRPPCPTLAELAALAAGEPRPGIALHVESCKRCSRRVEAARRAIQTNVSQAAIAQSAREVDALVEALLELPARDRPSAATRAEYLRPAVAQRFSELAKAAWERDLNVALDHIHIATLIAGRLAAHAGTVGELEFETWKNRSTIHRERGEMDAARAALTRAANAIDRCDDRELKRAIVWYADAAICASRDVWEPGQALALLARCEAVFRLRDPARSRDAQTLRGIVHLHAGEYAAAVDDFAAVASRTDPASLAARADALRNLANALIRVGRVDEAESLLRDVRAVDVDLGRDLQVARDDALAAVAAEARGDFETAALGFADVRHRFAAAGEHESAMIAAKDLAVALVATDRVAEAATVLRDLLAISISGSDDRKRFAAEALAYLKDLAQREQLTLDIASAVSTYVDRIHVQRAVPFTPPMSPLTM